MHCLLIFCIFFEVLIMVFVNYTYIVTHDQSFYLVTCCIGVQSKAQGPGEELSKYMYPSI